MTEPRFEVIFSPGALKEIEKLDRSVAKIVAKYIDRLTFRADEIGKALHNYEGTNLAGCKELKLRDAGIRIIFIVTDTVVEVLRIVYILAVERRDDGRVFKIASKRYEDFIEDSTAAITAAEVIEPKKE